MTELEIRLEAEDYAIKKGYTGAAKVAAEYGFIVGAKFVLQNLQQTPCTALRELLDEKLSREYAARDFAVRENAIVQQHRASARIALLQQLIDACQPVA